MPPVPSAGVSVIMPTYNGERYLGSALRSLAAQADPPVEVLVVDDGSSDRTVAVAESFASRLPLRVIRPTPCRSWMAMTNIGLAEASAPWAAVLHQDDAWLPGRGRHVKGHAADPVALVVMDALFVDEAGRPLGPWRLPTAATAGSDIPDPVAPSLWVQNWVAVPAATFRTAAARAVGGLDEDLWYTADWDLWLKLARRGGVRCVPRPGAAFRVHGASQTVTGSRDLSGFREQMTTVQRRHAWALELGSDPGALRRAGALSTETNVVLAGLLHGEAVHVRSWVGAVRAAGRRGVATYLRNSSLSSRLTARVRSRFGGRLRPAPLP